MQTEYAKHISLSKCDHIGVNADPITNLGEILIVSLISYLQFIVIPIYCYIMYSAILLFVSPTVNHGPSGISSMIGGDVLNDSLIPLCQDSPGGNLYDDSLSSDKSYQSETNETNCTSGKIITGKISDELNELRLKSKNRVIIGHLNINSVRNKFEEFKMLTANNLDIILISETKLDASFPSKQFLIDGYSPPYRMDRSNSGGGLICFIRENITSKIIQTTFTNEGLFIEINLKKRKWLLFGGYNPQKCTIYDYLLDLSSQLDNLSNVYENIIIIGDFNSELTEPIMGNFCDTYGLLNLIKDPTCYKNPDNPSLIDLILTNKSSCFQHSRTYETGLSDFHKMTITVMKMSYIKLKPIVISYRDYKNYNNDKFRVDLASLSSQCVDSCYELFETNFMNILEKHAPLKSKFLRGNQQPFMNKELSKAIMVRSRLRNIYLKIRSPNNRTNYVKQRNFCVNLLRKTKSNYYNNLNIDDITDNRKFWKMVKPCFTDKVNTNEQITLVDNDKIISDSSTVADVMNTYFSNIVELLEIPLNDDIINNVDAIEDPVNRAIFKYSTHPSILKIIDTYPNINTFSIAHTTISNIENIISDLNLQKATTKNGIPTKLIKENVDMFSPILCYYFNTCIETNIFPFTLKLAAIKPTFKKDDRCKKENYRPVSLLPVVSKIFEKIVYTQISTYIHPFLSPIQCGFRKGHSAQHCLLVLLEKWRKSLDVKQAAGMLMTDLSKAFDCIRHDLLIAKLHAYGMDLRSLHYIYDYLSDRKQRVRINNVFSEWKDIKFGVPQGSILGPLFFNIYLIDLFMFTEQFDIVNYADDNTPYACEKSIEDVIVTLENSAASVFKWIKFNYLKANPEKSHVVLSDNHKRDINILSERIQNTPSETLLGITIDNDLKFDIHVKSLCKKANLKLHALARISSFMSSTKLRILMKSFILSQFNYCPLVWMFYSRECNNLINRVHERALRIAYKDYTSTFQDLLLNDKSVTIHNRNLQLLATEIYKYLNGFSPKIMEQIFSLNAHNHDLRSKISFRDYNFKTVHYGQQSIAYLAPRIWKQVPTDIKESISIRSFKLKIKSWVPMNCPCRLCKKYIPNLGFV